MRLNHSNHSNHRRSTLARRPRRPRRPRDRDRRPNRRARLPHASRTPPARLARVTHRATPTSRAPETVSGRARNRPSPRARPAFPPPRARDVDRCLRFASLRISHPRRHARVTPPRASARARERMIGIPKNRGTVGRRARLAIDPRRQRRRRDRAMDATGDATRARYFDIFPRSLARVRVDAIGRDGRSSARLPRVFRASSAESPGTAPNTRESGERERETDATTVETRTRGVDDARRWASARDARVAGGGGARARWRGSIVLWEV